MKLSVMNSRPIMLINCGCAGRNDELKTIDRIREYRNDIIGKLVDQSSLEEYLFFHFRIKTISDEQILIIKNALLIHAASPLDLIHFCRLVRKFDNSPNPDISAEDEMYFHYEIETLIERCLDLC